MGNVGTDGSNHQPEDCLRAYRNNKRLFFVLLNGKTVNNRKIGSSGVYSSGNQGILCKKGIKS